MEFVIEYVFFCLVGGGYVSSKIYVWKCDRLKFNLSQNCFICQNMTISTNSLTASWNVSYGSQSFKSCFVTTFLVLKCFSRNFTDLQRYIRLYRKIRTLYLSWLTTSKTVRVIFLKLWAGCMQNSEKNTYIWLLIKFIN